MCAQCMEKEVIRHKQRVNNINIQVNQPVMMNLFVYLGFRCDVITIIFSILFRFALTLFTTIFLSACAQIENCWPSMIVVGVVGRY